MSKLSPLTSLRENDLQISDGAVDGKGLRDAFRRLFAQLNPYFDGINKLASRGVTLVDNLKCDVASGKFSHGVAQQVALRTLKQANSVLVLSAESQVVQGAIVQMVPAPPTAKQPPLAAVTVWFLDTSAANVNCTLLLLPDGVQTSTVPSVVPGVAAYYTGLAQAVTSGSNYTYNFDTKVYDTDNAVTTGASPNWKFTCPAGKAGKYHVSAGAGFAALVTAASPACFIGIAVNGTEKIRGVRARCALGDNIGMHVSGDVLLAAGDTVSIIISQNSGVSQNTEAFALVNWVTIHRLLGY